MSLLSALRSHPEPARVATYGVLDSAPSPYGPDPVVHGWLPLGKVPADHTRGCGPCAVRGSGERCWHCGQPWGAS